VTTTSLCGNDARDKKVFVVTILATDKSFTQITVLVQRRLLVLRELQMIGIRVSSVLVVLRTLEQESCKVKTKVA